MSEHLWMWIGMAMYATFVMGYGMPGVVQGRALGLPARSHAVMAAAVVGAAGIAVVCVAKIAGAGS